MCPGAFLPLSNQVLTKIFCIFFYIYHIFDPFLKNVDN